MSKNCFRCTGELYNTNTIENFKAFDKQKLLESVGKKASVGNVLKNFTIYLVGIFSIFIILNNFQRRMIQNFV